MCTSMQNLAKRPTLEVHVVLFAAHEKHQAFITHTHRFNGPFSGTTRVSNWSEVSCVCPCVRMISFE